MPNATRLTQVIGNIDAATVNLSLAGTFPELAAMLDTFAGLRAGIEAVIATLPPPPVDTQPPAPAPRDSFHPRRLDRIYDEHENIQ